MLRRNFISILLACVLACVPTIGAAQDYYPPSIGDYDGAADYLSRGSDLTGNADGKVLLFSAWFRLDGSDGSHRGFISNDQNQGLGIWRLNDNTIGVKLFNDTPGIIFQQYSTATYTASSDWFHLLISIDLANAKAYMYVDDVSVGDTPSTLIDDTIDFTKTLWAIASGFGGIAKLNGAMSEVYFAQKYLDFSVTANRRKFISAAGHPVNLGPSCSTPTGTASIICMRTQFNNAGLNDGTGGDFVINGAPSYTQGPVPIPLTTWTPSTKRGRGGRGGLSTIQQEKR